MRFSFRHSSRLRRTSGYEVAGWRAGECFNAPSHHLTTPLLVTVRSAVVGLLFFCVAGAAVMPGVVQAQRLRLSSVDSLSSHARISLVTVLPGNDLYSMFGHSAFRVYDPAQDLDETYNYGTFDFTNPVSFALKFAYGQMDYMLSTAPFRRALAWYREVENRPVIEQVLNLTPEQRNAVFRYLQVNARPENRTYRYDFLFDNCSTRLRDVLEETLGGAAAFAPRPDPNESFRELVDPYVTDRPWLDLGIDLLFGLPTERIATPREATFLPLILKASFDHATIIHDSASQPLVARTDTLYWRPGGGLPKRDLPWPSFFFWVLLALGAWISVHEYRNGSPVVRAFDAVVFGFVGIAGMVIAFMWFFTEHTVTANNLNLLWAWPTHLVAAAAIARRAQGRALRLYLLAAAVVTTLTIALWWAWPQDLPPAVLPLCLLLVVRSSLREFYLRPKAVA